MNFASSKRKRLFSFFVVGICFILGQAYIIYFLQVPQSVNEHHERNLQDIRSWGCNRNEAPFIFVHIGKAGGGSVRARMAASAVNVTKTAWNDEDGSYYPIKGNASNSIIHGKFCNSRYPNARTEYVRTFEGTVLCHAETPLTTAIACNADVHRNRPACCGESSCPAVYVGHNLVGAEMHWLPLDFLRNWWKSVRLKREWERNDSNPFDWPVWCPEEFGRRRRPSDINEYNERYGSCSLPHQARFDTRVRELWHTTESGMAEDWSSLYASLPVLRATMVREPFSWLVSKFFWHRYRKHFDVQCHDYTTPISVNQSSIITLPHVRANRSDWLSITSLEYMMHLCGEDCLVRYERGKMSVDDVERQAGNNLRQSFAVVGLFNETDNFYEMVSARVDYMNMSRNPHLQGNRHTAVEGPEIERCKTLFADPMFQRQVRQVSPEVAALVRLYELAVKVNRFQLQELESCTVLE